MPQHERFFRRKTALPIWLLVILISASYTLYAERAFVSIPFDLGRLWIERESVSRSLDIPVSVTQITQATLTAQITMNHNDDLRVKFNDGEYVGFTTGPRPSVRLGTVTIPVKDLDAGTNTVVWSAQNSAAQFNKDMLTLKLYFEPANAPSGLGDNRAPELSFSAPPDKSLGDSVNFEVGMVSDADGIDEVQYWVYCDFFPMEDPKTPEFTHWRLVARSSSPPFAATWDTRPFPDQSNMKIKAIAYDKAGYATESNSVDGYSFDRSFSTQRYWSSKVAQDVNHPKEAVSWFRVSQRPEVQTVTFSLSEPIENLEKASKAYMAFHFWMLDGWWDENIGTVSINGNQAYEILIRRTRPEGAFSVVAIDPSELQAENNRMSFTCSSTGRTGYFLGTPGPVVYICTPKDQSTAKDRRLSRPADVYRAGPEYYTLTGKRIQPINAKSLPGVFITHSPDFGQPAKHYMVGR